MTLVTLDELMEPATVVLTVPEHPAAELAERHGYYEDTVNGRRVYVTKNDRDRAVIGPKRHRARGLLAFGRKRRKPQEKETPGSLERTITPGEALAHGLAQAAESLRTVEIPTIRFEVPSLTPPPPQEKRSMFRRISNWCSERFYDDVWHDSAQRTAKTVLYWGFTASAFVVFVKGLVWVVSL